MYFHTICYKLIVNSLRYVVVERLPHTLRATADHRTSHDICRFTTNSIPSRWHMRIMAGSNSANAH